jgi:uncharacterized protein (DUF2384 family)
MLAATIQTIPGYRFETVPDISKVEERERLSQSAMDGFFRITSAWGLSVDQQADLLGGIPRSTLYKLKQTAGTRTIDELTRISYVVGIYKALHILLPPDLANAWMTRPNDNLLFGGKTPLNYVLQTGFPGLQQVRSLLDSARGGQ